jgi:hypothetical protein
MKHANIIRFAAAVLASALVLPAMAQDVGTPNAGTIGVDTAQQKLKEVSVEKFEDAGFWMPSMSTDEGYITGRLFAGSPTGKAEDPLVGQPITIDPKASDTQVLGIRVDFLRRGYNSFEVRAKKPIPVEGITKTLSVWVAGRNYNHGLKILIVDAFGREFELPLGTLNFQGWKKLSVAVPPQGSDGVTGIVQRNYHYNNLMGIKVVGFKVDCDPIESFGVYYVYLDDLRAITDLFAEESRDSDDMVDAW